MRVNQRVIAFTSTTEESMELVPKEAGLTEEILAHQNDADPLLREADAELK
jgi:hypothetical protein